MGAPPCINCLFHYGYEPACNSFFLILPGGSHNPQKDAEEHQRFPATVATSSDYMIFTKGIYNVNYDIYIYKIIYGFPTFPSILGLQN